MFSVVFFLAGWMLLISCGGESEEVLAPPEVVVVTTQTEKVPIYQEFVGQIYGQKDIRIPARVEGFLEGIYFKQGSVVKKGQLLYTIDPQPFEAKVAAQMSKLAEAKTMLAKAQSDLNRIRPLAKINAVSQSELDAAVAQFEAAQAGVKAAEANLRAARIQLSYTRIKAPITGIIGKTQAKVGDFVGRSPNPVVLNTISKIDTILVDFFLNESQYLKLARAYLKNTNQDLEKVREAETRNLELILADGSVHPYKGGIMFVDRNIDPSTGAILVEAYFPNPRKLLRPGQYAKVRAEVDVVENGILIPQRAVSEFQGIYRVFVVNDSNVVQLREVKTGPTVKDKWLVLEGLKPGERVVVEGIQMLKPGMTVKPVAKTESADEPQP
jgi:membrane fusion protein (multidrug efflux system)